MLLTIDIGNSSITIGIFRKKDLLFKFSLPSSPRRSALTYRNKIRKAIKDKGINLVFDSAVLSSVVPQLTRVIQRSVADVIIKKPLIAKVSLKTGFVFDLERPEMVGTDRIVNALAAAETFSSPIVVVDFGTATTITALNERVFLGGAILPGVGLMGISLHAGTSRLPLIDLRAVPKQGKSLQAMGTDTMKAILSGIIYGTAGAVERIILEMERQTRCRFKVVVTGGYADRVVPVLRRDCVHDPDLTLKGLRILYERNS